MKRAPLPPDEDARLTALRQSEVLDTEPEEAFDQLTDMAARICGVPIALITLVDVDRQWFKSSVGLEIHETPRDVAFCAHTILERDLLVVQDALEDERFADNPLVTEEPAIRFYAGSPLVTHDDHAIGTFCVIDLVPRDLDDEQANALRTLSRHAAAMLELRRAKELLRVRAEEWERASSGGNASARAAAIETLGESFQRMVAERERAEATLRNLERELQPLAGHSRSLPPEIGEPLDTVVRGAETLLAHLGPDDLLCQEAARIHAAALRLGRALGRARA